MKKNKLFAIFVLAAAFIAVTTIKNDGALKTDDFTRLELQEAIDKLYNTLADRKQYDGIKNASTTAFADIDADLLQSAMTAAMNAYLPTPEARLDGYVLTARHKYPNGLNATVFSDEAGIVIIAFRGTDDKADIPSDVQIVNGELPEQFAEAQKLYEDVQRENPSAKIILAGHSLGGSLAQLIAANNPKAAAFACAPVGTGNVVKNNTELADTGNVYNYLTKGDAFSNTLPQIGTSRLFETKQVQEHAFQPHSVLNCLDR